MTEAFTIKYGIPLSDNILCLPRIRNWFYAARSLPIYESSQKATRVATAIMELLSETSLHALKFSASEAELKAKIIELNTLVFITWSQLPLNVMGVNHNLLSIEFRTSIQSHITALSTMSCILIQARAIQRLEQNNTLNDEEISEFLIDSHQKNYKIGSDAGKRAIISNLISRLTTDLSQNLKELGEENRQTITSLMVAFFPRVQKNS